MRYIFIILLAVFASVASYADELQTAYQKEYAYLLAEKKALESRLADLTNRHQGLTTRISDELDGLEAQYLAKRNRVDRLNQLILDATRDVDFNESDQLLLETTLIQARDSLKKIGLEVDEAKEQDAQLQDALTAANSRIAKDGEVHREQGQFFGLTGEMVHGEVIRLGRIARWGVSEQFSGALAPAGNGMFKLWDGQSAQSATALADNLRPAVLDTFLYDNPEQAIEKQEEKSFDEDLEAGGLIGKVIIALGIVGVILALIRIVLLVMFGANIQKITNKVNELVASGSLKDALKVCKKNISSASRVIAATLRNLEKDRDHIEDIVSESILYESSRIDRFGSAILVIAAVSPLLGLLGTVTGMISTFDIITEFGTGDPKLLSTGISEALITTKFGLVVAIPLLLIGNLLTSWASRTKSDLERAALNMINTHKDAVVAS